VVLSDIIKLGEQYIQEKTLLEKYKKIKRSWLHEMWTIWAQSEEERINKIDLDLLTQAMNNKILFKQIFKFEEDTETVKTISTIPNDILNAIEPLLDVLKDRFVF